MITEQNKAIMIGLAYLVFCVLYLGAPQLSLRTPTPAPHLPLDAVITFTPVAIWIYLSQFGLLLCAVWYAPNAVSRSVTLYSMLLVTLVSTLIFIVFPTVLERNVIESDALTALLWRGLYLADVPGNCFPSLHAALATLAVFPLWQRGRALKVVAPLWAGAVIYSALATKQHVILDVVAGAGLALLCRIAVSRLFESWADG